MEASLGISSAKTSSKNEVTRAIQEQKQVSDKVRLGSKPAFYCLYTVAGNLHSRGRQRENLSLKRIGSKGAGLSAVGSQSVDDWSPAAILGSMGFIESPIQAVSKPPPGPTVFEGNVIV